MYKKLESAEIFESINNIKGGRMFRICFESEVPMSAQSKKQFPGMAIKKVTETTVRTGVQYGNIKSVIDRRSNEEPKESTRTYTNNYEWVNQNRVKYNTNTGKNYIQVATIPSGANTKVQYVFEFEGNPVDVFNRDEKIEDMVASYAIPSYSKKKGTPEIMTISFDNIIRIGNTGKSINNL